MRRLALLAAASLVLALPVASHAETTEVGGIKFEQTTQLGGTKLQLNGAGVRYKAVFKVYAAGLYLPQKAATTEAVLAATGPRRMHIVMLREIDANELGKLFTRGMEQNASREEFSKVIPGVIKLGEIFAARKKLASGDYFSIDYVPGTGSTIVVNGKPAAEPIKEPEFFSALMKIWLGKAPADAQLKDALLGVAKAAPAKDPFN
ncbi:chalcone isomerase family protein [Piscinibacter sp. XHJ-5]|uniref:chalcone isomerase family protein n=1 Tax=Piscinibacter sp. XHJ-5 TaxID=3037797 RepID=UPI0024536593|nr:chalcone isomerase family protein [Piscinibacter sp. XHJ-5]